MIENYANEEWEELIENLYPFNKNCIKVKASKLNLKRNNYYFTDDDIQILKKYYSKLSVRELKEKYFPNKTESALMTKAYKLGIVSREKWTIQEIEKLKKFYPHYLNSELVEIYFPNRTEYSLQSQAEKYSLKKFQCRREYTEDELLNELINFSKYLGRTPSGEDIKSNKNIPSLSTYNRYFDGYANACREAGLEVNNLILFGNESHYLSSNGDICLSNAELIVTEFLIRNNIKYQKEVLYKDIINDSRCGLKRCDWLINNEIIIEYFGLPEKEYYKNKMITKKSICADNNLNLISLYRKDLNKLDMLLKTLTNTKSPTTIRQSS